MYTCAAAGWRVEEQQARLEIKSIIPPGPDAFDDQVDGLVKNVFDSERAHGVGGEGNKGWELAGFWGRADLVVQNIGVIWRRI